MIQRCVVWRQSAHILTYARHKQVGTPFLWGSRGVVVVATIRHSHTNTWIRSTVCTYVHNIALHDILCGKNQYLAVWLCFVVDFHMYTLHIPYYIGKESSHVFYLHRELVGSKAIQCVGFHFSVGIFVSAFNITTMFIIAFLRFNTISRSARFVYIKVLKGFYFLNILKIHFTRMRKLWSFAVDIWVECEFVNIFRL